MHIVVVCPGCQTAWRLNADMLGKRIHCPNPACRQIFLVDGKAAEEPPTSPPGQSSGTVGEVVPLLPAEGSAPAEPPLSPWHQNPAGWQPPRPSARIVREPRPEERPGEEPLPSGTQEVDWRTAPPRSRGKEPATPAPPAPAPPDWRSAPPPPRTPSAPPPSSARQPAPPQPPAGGDWRGASPPARQSPPAEQAPPVRRPEPRTPPPRPVPPQPVVATIVEEALPPESPVELSPGAWTAPPVRRGDIAATPPTEPVHEMATRRKRRSVFFMVGIGVAVILLLGIGTLFVWNYVINSEKRLAENAHKEYDEGHYGEAELQFRELSKKFAESENADNYRFMADLSHVRNLPNSIPLRHKEALEEAALFLTGNAKHPLMPEHAHGVGETYVFLAKDALDRVSSRPDPSVKELLDVIEGSLAEIAHAVQAGEPDKIRAKIADIRAQLAKEEQRRKDLELLRQFKPSIEGIRGAEHLMRVRGLLNDPDAKTYLDDLYRQHAKSVVYTNMPAARATPNRNVDSERVLLVGPRLQGETGDAGGQEGVVLALVRGVLYALRQGDGTVMWARRVGIDTTALPVRVQIPFNPELFLVLSADTSTVTALDMNGQAKWEYHLSAPVLGRPVVVNNRAFLATFDGQIHEIELALGQLIGRYTLGEGVKLSAGGVHQPGTNLVYFPADEWCVFVIDVEKHSCEKIMYTKHRSGSLRGEPTLAGWTERDPTTGQETPQGYLFLGVADELDSMHLEAYPVPIDNPRSPPLPMNPEPRFVGWTWFPAHQDAEKIILVTDAGKLVLLGVKQKRNEDNPLFSVGPPDPKHKGPDIDLAHFLKLKEQEKAVRGRSQIAYAAEPDNFWVLAHGELQRFCLLLTSRRGPDLLNLWQQPINLGSPLHAAQVFEYPFEQGAPNRTTLLVVTQPLNRQTSLATAVDAEDGTIRWQRQLGMVPRGEAQVIGPNVLALDQGGGLFQFDIEKFRESKDQWPVGGRSLSPALDEGETPAVLLPGPDGASAYEFAIPAAPVGENTRLVVRRYVHTEGAPPVVRQNIIELKERLALAGKPAIGPSGILVPLSDRSIYRLELDGSFKAKGPNWRTPGHEEADLHPHLAWLNADEFLTTDGTRKLFRWRWPANDNRYSAVPVTPIPDEPTLRMPANIVTVLAVPPAAGQASVRVLVAAADGLLYLVEGREFERVKTPEDGLKLAKQPPWNPHGKITSGPFLLPDGNIAIIADRNRLVCFTHGNPEPVWEYKSEAEAIVGQPQLIDNILVVADQSGLYIGLDPANGKRVGKGYKLHTSAGPAASPVRFGEGMAFAPLTDGTVLLLDLKSLQEK